MADPSPRISFVSLPLLCLIFFIIMQFSGNIMIGTNPFGLAPPVLEILNPPLKMFNYKFSWLYMGKSNFPIWPLGLKIIMHRLILPVNVNDAFRSTTRMCIRDLLQIPSQKCVIHLVVVILDISQICKYFEVWPISHIIKVTINV